MQLRNLQGHSFIATEGGRFSIATPGCKPGDKVCTFYGGAPLYVLRSGDTKGEPSTFCGAAFIAHLMEQHERDAARLGPDEIFSIK